MEILESRFRSAAIPVFFWMLTSARVQRSGIVDSTTLTTGTWQEGRQSALDPIGKPLEDGNLI